jgi:hypothetical protein
MSILSEKIASIQLESTEKEAQVLEICSLLNTPYPVESTTKTNYKLKPVLIPHLIEEGIMQPEKLQAIATHPICADFLKAAVKDHYNGVTQLSPTIEQLMAAGRTFMIFTESDAQAVRDRLDIAKIVASDQSKPLVQQRYEELTEEVTQPDISWAQTNLGRVVDGNEVLEILGELHGSQENV